MRDPKRIKKFIRLLEEVWLRLPDYRFIQLIQALNVPDSKMHTDPFYWEDDVWEEMLNDALDTLKDSDSAEGEED